ncbi:hypothetical protein BST39_04530 [Mycobacterium paraseoulense]|uniref:Uncharacterized protein n=1 Tax=Mycobacterium paraseoulense TaxID=590652 RepID=A0A1X0IF46_9MYCO|nr:hypothetical protein BST39_04530 [Mycobacterium paraseoulense]
MGLEQEYLDGIEKKLYPATIREGSSLAIRPVGAFKVDANGAEWPSFAFLWRYGGGWKAWMDERKPISDDLEKTGASAELSADPGMVEFVRGATKWRKRSIETVLVPLSFSPLPPELPTRTAPGSILLEQRYTIGHGRVADFVAAMEKSVLSAVGDAGLELQLFSRVGHSPLEFAVFWSSSFDALGELFAGRDPRDESSFLPGLEKAWEHVVELTENTLIPMPFSPLGGTT